MGSMLDEFRDEMQGYVQSVGQAICNMRIQELGVQLDEKFEEVDH